MRARYVCTYVPRKIARYALAISTYTILYGDMVDVHALVYVMVTVGGHAQGGGLRTPILDCV